MEIWASVGGKYYIYNKQDVRDVAMIDLAQDKVQSWVLKSRIINLGVG
jgi:hypothetical protein